MGLAVLVPVMGIWSRRFPLLASREDGGSTSQALS